MGIPGLRACRIHLGALAAVLSLLGCAHTRTVIVEVPPRIDLRPHHTIGIVEFSSNTTEDLNRAATQSFMGFVQEAQPEVRFLELGPEYRLARSVGRDSLDMEALQKIQERYGIRSIFTGHFEISGVKPRVSLGADLSSVRASAVVSVSMVSKQWETGSGATIWSNSRRGLWKVAGIRSDSGDLSFHVNNPEDQYERHLEELAFAITDPFRPHYEKRKVPK